MTDVDAWPALTLDGWLPTYETLHRWTQIVGKTRLALAPFENHWWHTALYVSTRGLTTSPMPFARGSVEVEFDFLSHLLVARTSDGRTRTLPLESNSVAAFYDEYRALLAELGVVAPIHPVPNEIAEAIPFAEDEVHATFDGDAARRWWRALVSVDRVFKEFRGEFAGKRSPSHFWWGAFDLACTRFSGRRAPDHPGGVPNCPNYVMREAYSHECISAGWWPGSPGSPVAEPAFYAYAYPEPAGYRLARVQPTMATYQTDMGEWVLPYEAVRTSPDPIRLVTAFLVSTYETAASLAGWDVAAFRATRPSSPTETVTE